MWPGLQRTAEQSRAACTSPLLPLPGQNQDHKTRFKAKRHQGRSCQKEHVEDGTIGEVGCLSPYKAGSESMLIWSWLAMEIAVKPTAKEAFLQALSWKHTSCQGPNREKTANVPFLSAVDCCYRTTVSRWKEVLGSQLAKGTPRGHSWTNWSFRCASPRFCWVPSLLLPCVCQITALEWTGRHPQLVPGSPR